jgi:serine/threonine protein kinase
MMVHGASPSTLWSRREHGWFKACAKALMLDEPALRPRLGRFGLVRMLGHGAHGAVYEAEDTERGGRVALKVLRKTEALSVEAFECEFRALGGLVHENLVEMYELFTTEGPCFFTMELVEGCDFVSFAQPRVEFGASDPFVRLRCALFSLAYGVRVIHRAGKVHCDLKPSNVRVTTNGRVVILDYGLVWRRAGHTWPSTARQAAVPYGTPEYMAPELFRSSAPTSASDMYAIGVMTFVALTGRLPFREKRRAGRESVHLREPPRPSQIAGGVPRDLETLCMSMLTVEPGARPTFDELVTLLRSPSRFS